MAKKMNMMGRKTESELADLSQELCDIGTWLLPRRHPADIHRFSGGDVVK